MSGPDMFQMARAEELAALISRYQDSYYNGEAEIPDARFDELWDELKSLDPANPVLHRVGQDSGGFAKAAHRIPMGSQEKAANPEEFLSWAERHAFGEYIVEHKLDGASIELQYDGGVFVRAVTRGNGTVGDDITPNARRMQGVLGELRPGGVLMPVTGGVRGEVIMTRAVHRELFPGKANCRNAANGLMKRKDGSGSEHLRVICYDAFFRDHAFTDEEEKVAWLSSCGFETVPLRVCRTASDVVGYRASVMEARASLPYDIDGLVVKPREIDMEDAFRARPDRQIAFKFSPEEAVTVLRGVEWSESGATYTPVAVFDPVELAGTTVRRASLVNPNTIRSLEARIGSRVVVTKRGEIIPKIESVVPAPPGSARDESDIVFPRECSACGSALTDDGTRLYCPSAGCPKRVLHRLEKWAAVLEIRDLGSTLLRSLFDDGRVGSVSDLYRLGEDDLAPYFLGEDSISREKRSLGAQKVVKSIRRHSTVTLEALVAGFDIEGIGETLMEKVVSAGFDTLDKLAAAAPEELAAVPGFGGITAACLAQGLAECIPEMRRLVESGAVTLRLPSGGGGLSGKSFCFTGELSMRRAEAERLVRNKGGSVRSSVVRGLSYLVTNDTSSGSSKNRRAAELGIPVIGEEEFLSIVAAAT